MKLRARLLFVTVGALLVPVLVVIAVAAAVVVESSGRSPEVRVASALGDVPHLEKVRHGLSSEKAGVNVGRTRIISFAAVGLLSAFAGFVVSAEVQFYWPTLGMATC